MFIRKIFFVSLLILAGATAPVAAMQQPDKKRKNNQDSDQKNKKIKLMPEEKKQEKQEAPVVSQPSVIDNSLQKRDVNSALLLQNEPPKQQNEKLSENEKTQKIEQQKTEKRMCCICREDLEQTDDIVRPGCGKCNGLPLGHTFHRECLKNWIIGNGDKCPTCKEKLPEHLMKKFIGERQINPENFISRYELTSPTFDESFQEVLNSINQYYESLITRAYRMFFERH